MREKDSIFVKRSNWKEWPYQKILNRTERDRLLMW